MSFDWFADLTGFREQSYEDTRRKLEVIGTRLRSRINGRSYEIGELETPSLAELRARAVPLISRLKGALQVSTVSADVGALHRDPLNRDALFQVASQFNLLEMPSATVTPETGVTRYDADPTQGPACAIAAGAATIYRNYFVPVDGHVGQTRERQIDCLRDVGEALGNRTGALWTMCNGYAMCTVEGLAAIARTLDSLDEPGRAALRDRLRVGVQWNVEVTGAGRSDLRVSQVFCAALPVKYTRIAADHWQPFATLVLDAAYEATVWAAIVNAHRSSSNRVYLTQVGAGAFGNDAAWIHAAMWRALNLVRGIELDVRLVSRHHPSPALQQLQRDFG